MREIGYSRRDLLKTSAALAATIYASPLRAAAPEPSAITPALLAAAREDGKLAFRSMRWSRKDPDGRLLQPSRS